MNTRTVLLWHNNGAERIYLTVNPASIRVSRPNVNRVEPLALGGSINLWGGRGLREVALETFLPAETSPFSDGQAPDTVISRLKSWQDSGDPIRLIISDTDINDAFLIEDVTELFREGDRDVGIAVTLREYKFRVLVTASASQGSGTQSAGRVDERPAQSTYVVKKGDTLWDIACRFYGDGTKWGTIAQKNGVTDPRKLQIGTVLQV